MSEFNVSIAPISAPKIDDINLSSGGIIKYDKLKNITAGDVPEIDYSQGIAINYDNIGEKLSAVTNSVVSNVSGIESAFSKEILPIAQKALIGLGATAAVAGISFAEGLGEFGEATVDFLDMLGTAVVTPVLALADAGQAIYGAVTGKEWNSVTEDMWKGTMSRVSKKVVKSYFDSQYNNNNIMKSLKDNSFAFDQTRTIFSGIGYYTGVAALTVATAGTAGIATNTSAAIVSGATGISQGSEEAWSNGASLTGGLVAGAENGAWEGLKGYLGGTVLQKGFINVNTGSSIGVKMANEALKVGANAAVTGADPVVKAAIGTNYKGSFVSNFNEMGGWNSVKNSALTGAFFTASFDSLGSIANKSNSLEISNNIKNHVEDCHNKGLYTLFDSDYAKRIFSGKSKNNDSEFFYDYLKEWDDTLPVPKEVGNKIENIISDPNYYYGIHRTAVDNDALNSKLVHDICNDGLKNFGDLSSGSFDLKPEVNKTVSMIDNMPKAMMLFKSNYKGSTGGFLLAFPKNLISKDGDVLENMFNNVYITNEGMAPTIKPEFIKGYVDTKTGVMNYFSREQLLNK